MNINKEDYDSDLEDFDGQEEIKEDMIQESDPQGNIYGDKKPTNKVIIEVRNVQKTYLLGAEGVPALRGVSIKVYQGEFLCILGTSGGGKTTLLNTMGTIDKPTKVISFLDFGSLK